jgi:hypothetical protein
MTKSFVNGAACVSGPSANPKQSSTQKANSPLMSETSTPILSTVQNLAVSTKRPLGVATCASAMSIQHTRSWLAISALCQVASSTQLETISYSSTHEKSTALMDVLLVDAPEEVAMASAPVIAC